MKNLGKNDSCTFPYLRVWLWLYKVRAPPKIFDSIKHTNHFKFLLNKTLQFLNILKRAGSMEAFSFSVLPLAINCLCFSDHIWVLCSIYLQLISRHMTDMTKEFIRSIFLTFSINGFMKVDTAFKY